ncbi:MAG: Eco47II family restriction endonuclease [Bacteroidota bacterium]
MPKLNWISDQDLNNAVNHLLVKAKEAEEKVNKKFGKNVIDPFSALFVMAGFGLNYSAWKKTEATRQAQKTLQNHVGEFHQIVLGSVKGWENLQTGNIVDLAASKHKILAEVKNKHNTISGGKLADLYYSLEGLVMPKNSVYKDFTAYYVAIIPRKSTRYNKEFTPPDKSKGAKCPKNRLIREIDGASFYDLVTGEKNALSQLYNKLPKVIEECTKGKYIFNDTKVLRSFFDTAFEDMD